MVESTEAIVAALITAWAVFAPALISAERGGLRSDNEHVVNELPKGASTEKTELVLDGELPEMKRWLIESEEDIGPVPMEGMLGVLDEIDDEAFLDPYGSGRLLKEASDAGENHADNAISREGQLRGVFDRSNSGHRGVDGAEEGTDNEGFDNRIVNGLPTSGNYKAMCITMKKVGSNYFKGSCGCQAISPNYVVLAAHCHSNMRENDLGVNLDAFYFNPMNIYKKDMYGRANDGNPFQIVDKAWCQRHPSHKPGGAAPHDVMVCKTDKPIHSMIQAAIPHVAAASYVSALKAGDTLWTIGMGQTYNGGPMSKINMEVALPFVPWSTCKSMLSSWNLDSTMTCAGGDGWGDACGGDSGGPLCVRENNGRHVQIGVTSWGYQCNVRGYPGVWSNLGAQLDWIEQICAGDTLKIAY